MAHSMLSPSGAHRWLACTPSAVLERQFPDQGSDAAAEGTLAHELAELKLRNFFQAADFGKTKFTRAVNALKGIRCGRMRCRATRIHIWIM